MDPGNLSGYLLIFSSTFRKPIGSGGFNGDGRVTGGASYYGERMLLDRKTFA